MAFLGQSACHLTSYKTTTSVIQKKRKSNFLIKLWKNLGPGLITGASDDDPSGIATYSQAGAMYGLATLWTALLSYPLMVAVQEMCARIGIVSSGPRALVEMVKRALL